MSMLKLSKDTTVYENNVTGTILIGCIDVSRRKKKNSVPRDTSPIIKTTDINGIGRDFVGRQKRR